MKKLLASCLLFSVWSVFTTNHADAQSNFPFPTDYAEWHYRTVSPIIGPNDMFSHRREILEGDSVFNGKLYSKVYSQLLCQCECTSQNGNYTQPWGGQNKSLLGGVREEAGKVYFTTFGKPPFTSYFRPVIDTLLFDFTLNVGDSLDYESGIRFAVTKVDSTTEGRRRVHLLTYYNQIPKPVIWVEGIGYDWGLFSTGDFVTNYTYFTGFSCFNVAPDVCGIPCALTDVSELDQDNQIRLYPSFAVSELFLELGDAFENTKGEVFSADGRKMMTLQESGKSTKIKVNSWPSGMYFFVLENAKGLKVTKTYLR